MAEMKDSGIKWCGMVPKDWNIMPNKYVMYKKKDLCARYSGEDILSLTMEGVIVRDLEAGGKMPATFDGYQIIHSNNLLMCLFDYDVTPRCIGLIKNEGLISPSYSQFVLKNGNVAKYYYYYYLMIDNTKELLHLAKNLRHSFTEEQLGTINTPVPPVEVQKKIADFLDYKCAEIDSLYVDIEKQIEVLEEYKKSIITEAVTKGIDPDVEMKDSGVEWIGMIPKDWCITKIKFLCTMQSGSNITAQDINPNEDDINCYCVYGANGLRGYYNKFTHIGKYCLIGRQGALAGNVHLVNTTFWATDHAVVVYTNNLVSQNYMYYLLTSMNLNQYSFDTAAQPGLAVSKIMNLPMVYPDMALQLKIVHFLDKKCAEIDNVIADKKQQLEILEEYKKSLIYEYVTGKKEVPDNE